VVVYLPLSVRQVVRLLDSAFFGDILTTHVHLAIGNIAPIHLPLPKIAIRFRGSMSNSSH
jgi:hypothetical protein